MVACAVILSGLSAQALDCICAKFPSGMSGGGWAHYALVYRMSGDNCVMQYPTSVILPTQTFNQNCGPNCGTCAVLGSDILDPGSMFVTTPIKRYDEVDEAAEIRSYFVGPSGAPNPLYDNSDFTDQRLVALKRPANEGGQTFYAVVWKMQPKLPANRHPGAFSNVGIEVSAPADVSHARTAQRIDGAVSTRIINDQATHTPIPGLLQVEVDGQTAFIQLNQQTSGASQFPPFDPETRIGLIAPEGPGNCGPVACAPQVACCPAEPCRCRRVLRLMRRCRCR